jgi:hypothetical protein
MVVVISVLAAAVLVAVVLGVRSARRRRRVNVSEPIKLPGVKFHL